MVTRRQFLNGSGAVLLGAALVSKAGAAALPEAPSSASAATQPPLAPREGRPYNPVVTLNGWSLPWRMRHGWKEFHLVAETVVREIAPGMQANLWGYNGQAPGPTMTGQGPFGALEMGGMFTVVKVREVLGRDDYRDPGWYRHPKGTVAYEYAQEPAATRGTDAGYGPVLSNHHKG